MSAKDPITVIYFDTASFLEDFRSVKHQETSVH